MLHCTVFDSEATAGGFIRSQIPRFRLPESIIDEETGYILDLGVKFEPGVRIDSMRALPVVVDGTKILGVFFQR